MAVNRVFIACSLDGYIADRNGGIDWLSAIPNPDQIDMGYHEFMKGIDALLMGRKTYEKVLSFGIPWPYDKPVYVWSHTLKSIPEELKGKVELVRGPVAAVLSVINGKGHFQLYIDGGSTIQSFLKENRIDEMIITRIPLLLGGGIPLFGELPELMTFSLVKSEVFLGQIVQNTYKRNV